MNDDDLDMTPLHRFSASRRSFFAAAAATVGAGSLAACASGGGGDDDNAGGGVKTGEASDENPFGVKKDDPLDVVIFDGGYGDEYAKDVGKKYQETYPDAKVKVSSTVNIQPELQPRFVGGNPPDLFDNSGAQQMSNEALINQKQLSELDQLLDVVGLDGEKISDTLLPGATDPGVYSGKQYAMMYVFTVFGLWFSQKQFDDEGWTPPKTWDEVMTIGENAKKKDISLFSFGGQNASDYYQELAVSMAIKQGGIDVAHNLDKLDAKAFEQKAIVDAYQAIEDAVKAGFFQKGGAGIKHTEAQTQWVTGKSVMYPSGSWIENEQRGVTPKGYKMNVVPTPVLGNGASFPETAIHAAAGEPFLVPSKAKNGAGGLEFLRIMLSKEQCTNFTKLTSSPTIVKDTIPEDAFGSTALQGTNKILEAAGEDTFHFHAWEWYGLGPDAVTLWTQFLSGSMSAAELREKSQALFDKIREDDSITKFDVE